MQRDGSPAQTAAWPIADLYISRLCKYLGMIDVEAFERLVQLLRTAYETDSCIFVAGNGGSSATASHWVNDMHKTSLIDGRRGIRAMSLSDNVPLLTAFANDEGYESVFHRQMVSHVRTGDVLVLISVSGNSPNLVRAAQFARERETAAVGLLGWDGGLLAGLVSEAVVVPAPHGEYPVVESAHNLLCAVITEAITA